MKPLPLDDSALDRARLRGDPEAEAWLEHGTHDVPLRMQPPDWLDPVRALRAQRFSEAHLVHITMALFYASLPTAYATPRGPAVLIASGRTSEDVERRVNETARLLLDVLEPFALDTGGKGLAALRQVRLAHARARLALSRPEQREVPINQEDSLGTLFTFSIVMLRALRRLGVPVSPAEADDFYHLWRAYGVLLGVEEALLPTDLAAAEVLYETIARRQLAPCPLGIELMQVLSRRIAAQVPFPETTSYLVRRLAGDRVADLLGVPSEQELREVWMSREPQLPQLSAPPQLLGLTPVIGRPLLDTIVQRKLRARGIG
jgi:hypothetical protein